MREYKLRIGDREFLAEVREITAERARVAVDGAEYDVDLIEFGRAPEAAAPARTAPTTAPPTAPPRPATTPSGGPGTVQAPLPGLVLELKVKEGDSIQAGQPLVVMEAMKMENVVPAPHTGTVRRIHVAAGDSVGEGDPLVDVARPEMTTL
jgi:biotin carboxyl carrier protein